MLDSLSFVRLAPNPRLLLTMPFPNLSPQIHHDHLIDDFFSRVAPKMFFNRQSGNNNDGSAIPLPPIKGSITARIFGVGVGF